MYELVFNYVRQLLSLDVIYITYISYAITIFVIILFAYISDLVTKKILMKIIKKIVVKTKNTFDEILYEKKAFHNLAHIVPAIVIYLFAGSFNTYSEIIKKIILCIIILMICLVFFKVLDALVEVYSHQSYSKGRPIKGVIQIIKIFIAAFGALFVLAIFTGDSNIKALLGGISGMSAILILIFKDSILGLVAGIQLSADKLLAIGDWVEMPKYDADGEVVDISLTKIVIKNFDKTYTTIPAYRFLEDSFKNWEGMTQAGGRRIKRSIYIDMTSIRFLTEEELNKLSKVEAIKAYIHDKLEIINEYNEKLNNEGDMLSKRRLTNIGTFRAYTLEYLKRQNEIHQNNFTMLVRQLAPTDKGLPLEIYCFTTTTDWVLYEGIQGDIFDHLFAAIKEFDLQVYQAPTNAVFNQISPIIKK